MNFKTWLYSSYLEFIGFKPAYVLVSKGKKVACCPDCGPFRGFSKDISPEPKIKTISCHNCKQSFYYYG